MFAQTAQTTKFILDCLAAILKISLNSSISRQATIVQYLQKTQANPVTPPQTHLLLKVNSCHAQTSRHVTNVTTRTMVSKYFVVMKVLFIRFDVRQSVHHHMIQVIQPTRCNSFTRLLLDVYVWLNMFRASLRPSSGAYNCTRSLWFYRWIVAVEAL
jgi:hypothetical protein